MRSDDRDEIAADFTALREVVSRVLSHSYDALTTPDRLTYLERLECETRRLRVPGHQLINQLAEQSDAADLGGRLAHVLADRLRITRGEANRRVAEAADLGPRRAMTGEPLPAQLTATAAAQRRGEIGDGHIKVIRQFLHQLPTAVDVGTREAAEQHLARLSAQFRPDQVAGLAERLADCINPDGTYTDADRARRRGLVFGKQGLDGMSELRGLLTPEARATFEAVMAKLAAPGMCNPDDEQPVLDAAPDEDAVRRDSRSQVQRNHDALLAGLRGVLASGNLGTHNGLPVSVVVTTTLKDLEAATGKALTGGGTLVPMSDVIRWAGHAHHYLAIFDKGRPLALYHTKRLATRGQRIMLYAKDRGCTKPGCDAPAYHSQVHHVTGWPNSRRTDIDDLTLACGPDNRLAEQGWTTRKNANGDTEWIPPPHQDHGQPRINNYHHPEKILAEEDDDDP